MDTKKLIETLNNWKSALVNQQSGLKDQQDILDSVLQLLTEGYKTDQVRIDADVQKAKDDLAENVSELENQVESLKLDKDNLIAQTAELSKTIEATP